VSFFETQYSCTLLQYERNVLSVVLERVTGFFVSHIYIYTCLIIDVPFTRPISPVLLHD